MKTAPVLVALLGLGAGMMAAADLRVTTQVIELPQRVLVEWGRGEALPGPEWHRRAMALVARQEARVVDTSVVAGRAGERPAVESITEVIYPTEYEPPELPTTVPSGSFLGRKSGKCFPDLRPNTATAFETRNVGVTLEVAPGLDGPRVSVRSELKLVQLESMTTWLDSRDPWGEVLVRFPRFRSLRMQPDLTLSPGRFELVGVFTPEPVAVPAVEKRWLVFLRAEVLRVPTG